jgi:flagellar hook-basal body complex protein FliE
MIDGVGAYTPFAAGVQSRGPAVGAAVAPGNVAGVSAAGAVQPRLPTDFTSVLSDLAGQAMQTLKTGEAASIAGVRGKLSVQETVEAVMESERTLQTAIAVRDKVVSAYLELSRMAI